MGAQKRKVSKIWTISCITPKRYEIGCQLLFTNRKSHTGFRLVPTSMTLNDHERRNSPYFAFFTEFDNFAGRLCHSGWRWTYIMSVKYCLAVPVFHFWPKLTHPAARSLCEPDWLQKHRQKCSSGSRKFMTVQHLIVFSKASSMTQLINGANVFVREFMWKDLSNI